MVDAGQDRNDPRSVDEVRKHGVGAEPFELLGLVPAGRDEEAVGTTGLRAGKIARRVADDPGLIRCVAPVAELDLVPPGERQELRPVGVVPPVRANFEVEEA